jgi:type VI secretion system protein ImpK
MARLPDRDAPPPKRRPAAGRRDADENEELEHDEGDESPRSLSALCTDLFLLGLQIRSGRLELPACDTLRRRVLQQFEALKSRAHRAGVLPTDVDDARYALAAYLDEVIQYSEWPGKEEWASSPLQASLFGESKAGARFFERLHEVRKRSPAALAVYYQCLVLGFMGEYRVTNPHELEELVDDLRRDLTAGLPKAVSPHGRPPEAIGLGGRSLPLVPIASIVLLLAIGTVVLLYFILRGSGIEAADALQQIGRG